MHINYFANSMAPFQIENQNPMAFKRPPPPPDAQPIFKKPPGSQQPTQGPAIYNSQRQKDPAAKTLSVAQNGQPNSYSRLQQMIADQQKAKLGEARPATSKQTSTSKVLVISNSHNKGLASETTAHSNQVTTL